MKNNLVLNICICLFVLFPSVLISQSLNTILYQDVSTNGKVLNIEISQEYEGTFFVIGLVIDNNIIANTAYIANAGQHSYDIRDLGREIKKVDFVATSLPKKAILKSTLIAPNLWQEIDILFSKNIFSPKSVNFVPLKRFKGNAFTITVFLFLCIAFCVLSFFLKQPFWKAAFISFLLGTIMVDVTNIRDQWEIYRDSERTFPYIAAVAQTQVFIEEIKPKLLGEMWTFHGKFEDEYQKLFIKYSLADIEFVPESLRSIPKGTFIITSKQPDQNQEIITKGKQFFLLKQR